MLDKIIRLFSSHEAKVYTATKCGHNTLLHGYISAHGETRKGQLYLDDNGSVDYCLECVNKMTIQCAWCGKPIFVGDPITLHWLIAGRDRPAHAVAFDSKDRQFFGCSRGTCAIGMDIRGYWYYGENGQGQALFDICALAEPPVFPHLDFTIVNDDCYEPTLATISKA